jgi:hypothetical protein
VSIGVGIWEQQASIVGQREKARVFREAFLEEVGFDLGHENWEECAEGWRREANNGSRGVSAAHLESFFGVWGRGEAHCALGSEEDRETGVSSG